MPHIVDDPAIALYERDGYVVFRNVIDADLIAEARRHVEWLQRRYPTLRPEHFHHPVMSNDAFWARLVTDDRLADIAERFLGPDLACFTADYICKPPKDGEAVLWHQDGAYWDLEPMEAVTIWLAVDDADAENGCLRVIPGSHRRDIGRLVGRVDVRNMLGSSLDPRSVDAAAAVDVTLRAGDVSVHHPFTIHGSEANRSRRRRCGVDIVYTRTATRVGEMGLYLSPILVRGEAEAGINQYRPWPLYDSRRTIPFRGSERWNRRARELNRRPGVVAGLADLDVGRIMAHMIERLRAGMAPRV
jgi:ectoine hydroxylase-related dioxygenase (phytanoyl-CoA dioxygenase family)